ncbi:MAG: aconitate hydratase [Spirochaetales bacterium]|uniref:Aconitate hydratase A n=1 Tax=Candidatus Thalassospirochaeta sargassi TaxID=3119039 RepID=A0AAJ1IA76_9SPIO|nr:aconitate hydratase [Spirochaetales bacterium]
MGLTLTEKILKEHLVSGELKAGNEIGIKIDQTLTQDATGTMVYLQFESMDISRIKTELSVSYVDHNTLQTDYRNMDDHRFLQSAAAKFGLHFSRPGNGICHQIHLERFGVPGKTLLGSDSHTPTGGGLGMISIGAGGLDVAAAMAGAPFYLKSPEVIGVHLTGSLQPMCSAKDIILTVLQLETVKGGVGRVYEYYGEGVKSLSVPERATITNMGAELGATTSVFPSDDETKAFLRLQKREELWKELSADNDAEYCKVIEINLDEVVPMVALPHMPDNVKKVSEIAGLPVNQVAIGSCTNSSINDLGIAADILDGKTIAENLSLGISPGSRQVINSGIEAGIIKKLVSSGARILESACGACIGMGFSPTSGGVTVRTFNRNFKGRSGTADAEVYLVSPETAAATALTGVITDPRDFASISRKDYTSFIEIDDNMIIKPLGETDAAEVQIVRGPNIKPCPKADAMYEKLEAPVLLKTGDNITTDHIMPAGAKILPLRSNIPEISKHVFEALAPEFHDKAKKAGNGVIVGGENYGQGSSREHAALAPMYLGVKAVITKSFARIHKANLINFGIIPFTFADTADYDLISEGDVIVIDNLREGVQKTRTLKAVNKSNGKEFNIEHDMADRQLEIILEGGLLNYTKSRS